MCGLSPATIVDVCFTHERTCAASYVVYLLASLVQLGPIAVRAEMGNRACECFVMLIPLKLAKA
jgi:hypothetical protein